MQKRIKKTLSFVIAIALMISVLAVAPATVGASEVECDTWQKVQDAFTAGNDVKLTGNITALGGDTVLTIPAGKTLTLDLNGFTIDRGLTDKAAVSNGGVIMLSAAVNTGANLTIEDSSATDAPPGTGKITGGNTTSDGGGIYAGRNCTLTIKGGAISGNKAQQPCDGGGVFCSDAVFNMSGGTIGGSTEADKNSARYGGGVYLYATNEDISCEITNGAISGNKASSGGGGVYISSYNKTLSLTMSGGTIGGSGEGDANSAGSGGGVYISGQNTFTLEQGAITGNKVSGNYSGGGGVFIYSRGTFDMSGGSITHNTATGNNSKGGGVYVYGSEDTGAGGFIMHGGSITGNTAPEGGGVNTRENGSLKVYGAPVISGNKSSGGKTSNVYLLSGKTIDIDSASGALTPGASIGVSAADTPTEDNDVQITTVCSAGGAKYFFSDDSSFKAAEKKQGGDGPFVFLTLPQEEPPIVIPKYAVTVAAEPEEAGTVTGGGTFDYASRQTVTAAAANEGWEFIGWKDARGRTASKDAQYLFTVTGKTALTASFKRVKYKLTIEGGTFSAGEITGTSGWLSESETVLIAANMSDLFSKWVVVCGNAQLTDERASETDFKMPACDLYIAADPGHIVVVMNGSGGGRYSAGDTVQISADVLSGCRFLKWLVEDGPQGLLDDAEKNPTTFIMPDEDVILYASLEPIQKPASPKLKGENLSVGSAQLKWSKVAGDTGGYTVLRKTTGEDWQTIAAGLNSTTFTDYSMQTGKAYVYYVHATNEGITGLNSNPLSLRARAARPAELTGVLKDGKPVLSWQSPDGEQVRFRIVRFDTGAQNKEWKGIAIGITGASYTDVTAEAGHTYLYRVHAYSQTEAGNVFSYFSDSIDISVNIPHA